MKSGLFLFAVVMTLTAGFSGVAQAQSRPHLASPAADPDFYSWESRSSTWEGRSSALDAVATRDAVVPPSESNTVMGLRVPR